MKEVQLTGFGGAFSSIDPRDIGNNASDLLNVRVENTQIAPRFGYRTIASHQTGFTTGYGLVYLNGYTSALASTEEYVSFENISGTVYPFSRNVTTGAVTAITTSVPAQPSLNASDWVGAAFGSYAYFVNPNETISVKKYTQGTVASWTSLAIPAAPTVALTYAVQYPTSSGYTKRNYTGVVTADVTYTGIGVNTSWALDSASNFMTITHDGSKTSGAASFTIDLHAHGPGDQDWTYNDVFYFTMQGGAATWFLDPTSVAVSFTSATPTTFVPTITECKVVSPPSGSSGTVWGVRVEFSKSANTLVGYDRSTWSAIRKITVAYNVTNNALTKMYMSPITVGAIYPAWSRNTVLPSNLLFSYSYYYSANQWESGLSTATTTVPFVVAVGTAPSSLFNGLGTHIRITATTSGDTNVDDNRFYGYDPQTLQWRRIVTQADSTAYYDYKINYDEFHTFTPYVNVTPFKTDKCVNVATYKSWMVWFYKGGQDCIRHSRVGNPENQASDLDNPLLDSEPPLRGSTWSLPGFADEPLGGVEAGDAFLIAGTYGCYAQLGTAPAYLSPPKRIAGSFGVAGIHAFCAWRDDAGNPGMVYVSTGGQVYFVAVDPSFTGDTGATAPMLSGAIQTGTLSINTFLRDGQSLTSLSTVRVFVDDYTDSLWVVMKNRALVLRRPHPENATPRQWEAYEYPVNITYAAASTKRWLKCLTSTGNFIELERNSSTVANIDGSLRDDGSAISSCYWQSRTIVGPNSRLRRVFVERDNLANTPSLVATSSRQTSPSIVCGSGLRYVPFGPLQQGEGHSIKLIIGENDGAYHRIILHLFAAGGRYTS